MCEHGINIDQLKLSIAQISDALGTTQQSLEQLHHLADHGGLIDASAQIAQVTVMLGEARAKLDRAGELADGSTSTDVSVELL